MASIVPAILRTPRSLARALGVRVPSGEPWTLDAEGLAAWRPARALAEALFVDPKRAAVAADGEDFPPEMIAAWRRVFGDARAESLAATLGAAPPLSLRAAKKLGIDGARAALAKLGRPIERSRFAPFGMRLGAFERVAAIHDVAPGGLEVQDEGSQVMALFAVAPETFAPVLAAAPGAPADRERPPELSAIARPPTVIDTCAGAGGKTLAIADALGNRGRVFAYDVSARKLTELRRRARRAGLTSVKTVPIEEGRERELSEAHRASADLVLVDAPCSGWGVLKRNPDAKWRRDAPALARLEALQARLLDAFAILVAPGGRLVYGACTFRPEETVLQIDRFLASHPELSRGAGGFFGPGPTCDGFFMQEVKLAS